MNPPIPPRKPRSEGTNHILHLLLTFITCGLWFPMWFLSALIVMRQNARYRTQLSEYEHALIMYRIHVEREVRDSL